MAVCLPLGLILTATVLLVLLFSSPYLPAVSLASLTVSSFNITGDHISGYLNLQFQVQNPNWETDLSYKDVYSMVYRGKHRMGSTVFPGFIQAKRETSLINVTIHLTPGTTARGIGNDLATYCFAEFDVKLSTLIKWPLWSSHFVRVSCNNVAVGILPAAGGHSKMMGPPRTCRVL